MMILFCGEMQASRLTIYPLDRFIVSRNFNEQARLGLEVIFITRHERPHLQESLDPYRSNTENCTKKH